MSVKELLLGNAILIGAIGTVYTIITLIASYFDMTRFDVFTETVIILSVIFSTILVIVFVAALSSTIGEWTIRKYREYKNTKKYP